MLSVALLRDTGLGLGESLIDLLLRMIAPFSMSIDNDAEKLNEYIAHAATCLSRVDRRVRDCRRDRRELSMYC